MNTGRIVIKDTTSVALLREIVARLERIEAKLDAPKVEVKRRPAHLRSVRLDNERIET